MSVIVKGMEMPKKCDKCPMCAYHWNNGQIWCEVADAKLADNFTALMSTERPDWCPLVEVPDEHGCDGDSCPIEGVEQD